MERLEWLAASASLCREEMHVVLPITAPQLAFEMKDVFELTWFEGDSREWRFQSAASSIHIVSDKLPKRPRNLTRRLAGVRDGSIERSGQEGVYPISAVR